MDTNKQESHDDVEEESHTQGWEEQITDSYLRRNLNDLLNTVRSVAATEREAFEHEAAKYKVITLEGITYIRLNDAIKDKAAFDAGYAQCKVDAVAVVPGEMEKGIPRDIQDESSMGYNQCREEMLTALRSLTHKE